MRRNPQDSRARGGLANTYNYIARLLWQKGDLNQALEDEKQALSLRQTLAENDIPAMSRAAESWLQKALPEIQKRKNLLGGDADYPITAQQTIDAFFHALSDLPHTVDSATKRGFSVAGKGTAIAKLRPFVYCG